MFWFYLVMMCLTYFVLLITDQYTYEKLTEKMGTYFLLFPLLSLVWPAFVLGCTWCFLREESKKQ